MVTYPISVTLNLDPYDVRLHPTMYGVDLEQELIQAFVVEFQAIDPTLVEYHVRGEVVAQIRDRTETERDMTVMLTDPSTRLAEMWAEIPREFLVGYIHGLSTARTKKKSV